MLSNVDDVTCLSVLVVVDDAVTQHAQPLAFRAGHADATILLSGAQLSQVLGQYKARVTNVDLNALATAAPAPAAKPAKAQPKPKETKPQDDVVQIGMEVKKDDDLPKWYKQVLTKSEMLDYYDVSGCYIIRPWAFNIWKEITAFFDKEINDMGIEDAYFPMFVSHRALEREKDHIEGFAPEVAWVTKAGSSELDEPIAIRPTSETVMYPYFAKWIRSHRDLPLRVNQWCNVVRWEFKNPQPFLRTREFLWQEGHTAHLTKEGADEEVLEILELYRRVYEELLAIPVIKGIKSENEKFAGGLYTTTVEAFIPATGRGIQGATSHCLGQNFAKMFNITVEDPHAHESGNAEKLFVWQNSWGLTTRTIGVMVMVHGDDKGLVLPPRVAAIQVIVVPCGITAHTLADVKASIEAAVNKVVKDLQAVGVKAKADLRPNYTPGYKFNHWELRGVPVRLEIGPKDLANQTTLSVRRDNGVKAAIAVGDLATAIPAMLHDIQTGLLNRARDNLNARITKCHAWDQVVPALDNKCLVMLPWCEDGTCEDQIKERSATEAAERHATEHDDKAPSMGAKSLCIPFDQPQESLEGVKCVNCGAPSKRWTMFGRSY
jgi:prolyl-tRNA synthetase